MLSTAVVVAVDMEAGAVERTPADSAAVMPVGLAEVVAADSAAAVQLGSRADTRWWAVLVATRVDMAADRITLLALDTQQGFAVVMLVEASPMHTVT